MNKAWIVVLMMPSLALADAFDKVKCDADVAVALKGVDLAFGKKKVDAIEAAHKAIRLKFDGSDGADGDSYATSYWKVCDREIVTLHDMNRKTRDIVRDVLAVPEHPTGQKLGPPTRCRRGSANVDDVLPLMAKGTGAPSKAWRVDKKTFAFVVEPVEGLSCTSD
jgi:hypothetical protein